MADLADADHLETADEIEAPERVLLRSDAEGVAGLALNRPAAYNALSRELLDRAAARARPDQGRSLPPAWW